MRRRRLTALLALLLALFTAACGASDPAPDSDSEQSYNDGKIPVDKAVYEVTGVVAADVSSLTRQVKPGGGRIDAPVCAGTSGCYGGGGGTLFGPVEAGKGFVRLRVTAAKPATNLAPVGATIILKVTDTKGTALSPDDVVTFHCRRQYEAIAAVQDDQDWDDRVRDAVATWELDFCRLLTPIIASSPTPQ